MDTFPGMVIYISRLPGEGNMEDLFIVDERDPNRRHTIVSKTGQAVSGPARPHPPAALRRDHPFGGPGSALGPDGRVHHL